MTTAKRLSHPHLIFNELTVPAAGEWQPRLAGWSLIRVASGAGYWLQASANLELSNGTILVLADTLTGCIRSSRLGAMVLQFSRVDPARLNGLISLEGQRFLNAAANHPDKSVQILAPDAALAVRLKELYADRRSDSLRFRLRLIEIFVDCLGADQPDRIPMSLVSVADAKERLRESLQQMPSEDLLELTFDDLVQTVNCTPRHLTRIFREVVGVSFREKQAELRLARSLELLITSDAKVVDVALQSGFQSLSLFNFMFKRRFRMSPSQWREKGRRPEVSPSERRRSAPVFAA